MIFKRIRWDTSHFDALKVSLHGDGAILKKEIDTGISKLWEIDGGDSLMITRGESDTLVVCCFEGKNLVNAVYVIIAYCQTKRFDFLRFHTYNKAMVRMISKRFDFILTERRLSGEMVFIKDLRGLENG